tara:strand:+ start:702 stop:1295 length:594 start_codon:yes stop_codon:yes gene_type:complete
LISRNPIILIHGLWNTSDIFSSITPKLDEIDVEYFAPTLNHSFGMTSIIQLTDLLNKMIIDKYGCERELDILGFSMGGIIGRYWIKKFDGYKRTKRFFTIGTPHNGTLTSQLVPKYPFTGIAEMKINSYLLRDLSKYDYLLNNIECISFYTCWDLMVFPGWRANLNVGEKISLKIFKHRNLVRNLNAVERIVEKLKE